MVSIAVPEEIVSKRYILDGINLYSRLLVVFICLKNGSEKKSLN